MASSVVSVQREQQAGEGAAARTDLHQVIARAADAIAAHDALDHAGVVQEVLAEALAARRPVTPRGGISALRREVAGQAHRGGQAAHVGLAGAGQVERGAMVDRGAHDRQAERHVHGAARSRACLITGRPWSWYIASTASKRASTCGTKTVSAGSGPLTSHAAARAGARPPVR